MVKIIIIAAIGKNKELGKDNNLIWRIKEDLAFFKNTTMNHKIIMGYNTFKSLPGLLPGREEIVLTHQELVSENIKVFHSFEELMLFLNSLDEEVYVIGGASIYKLFINEADELLLTHINAEEKEADVYFPEFNTDDYKEEVLKEVQDTDIPYKRIRYIKK